MGAMLYLVSRSPRSAPTNAPTPEQIRAFRMAEGISQQALANLLDVSIGAVRKWEAPPAHGRIPRGRQIACADRSSRSELAQGPSSLVSELFDPGAQRHVPHRSLRIVNRRIGTSRWVLNVTRASRRKIGP